MASKQREHRRLHEGHLQGNNKMMNLLLKGKDIKSIKPLRIFFCSSKNKVANCFFNKFNAQGS